MEKMNCNIINDMLPLYLEGICSEETVEMVETHMKDCENCRKDLEYMKQNITIPETTTALEIKAVRRRILLEKIVVVLISVFAVLSVAVFVGIYLLADQVVMNPTLTESNVRIEEDANGEIWLVRGGKAIDASHIILDLYTMDGKVISELENGGIRLDVDRSHVVVKVMLYESRVSNLTHQMFGEQSSIEEERSRLFQKEEKTEYERIIFEHDGEETVLWERN